FWRFGVSCAAHQNSIILAYTEGVGGSNPSTPNPKRDKDLRHNPELPNLPTVQNRGTVSSNDTGWRYTDGTQGTGPLVRVEERVLLHAQRRPLPARRRAGGLPARAELPRRPGAVERDRLPRRGAARRPRQPRHRLRRALDRERREAGEDGDP